MHEFTKLLIAVGSLTSILHAMESNESPSPSQQTSVSSPALRLSIFYKDPDENGNLVTKKYNLQFPREVAKFSTTVKNILEDIPPEKHHKKINLGAFTTPDTFNRFQASINFIIDKENDSYDHDTITRLASENLWSYSVEKLCEQLKLYNFLDVNILYTACLLEFASRIQKNPSLVDIIQSDLNVDIRNKLARAIPCASYIYELWKPKTLLLKKQGRTKEIINLLAWDPEGTLLASYHHHPDMKKRKIKVRDLHADKSQQQGRMMATWSYQGLISAEFDQDKQKFNIYVEGLDENASIVYRSFLVSYKGRLSSITAGAKGHVVAIILEDENKSEKCCLWNTISGQWQIVRDNARTSRIACSPDETSFAYACAGDDDIYLYDPFSLALTAKLTGHTMKVSCLAYSPDTKSLASGGYDKTVCLWDLASKSLYRALEHRKCITAVCWNSDSSFLFSGDEKGVIRLWNVITGHCIKTISEHTDQILAFSFNPNKDILASSSLDGTICLSGAPITAINQACNNLSLRQVQLILEYYVAWKNHHKSSGKPFNFHWKQKGHEEKYARAQNLPLCLKKILQVPKN
jgi:WD40 repeat protein